MPLLQLAGVTKHYPTFSLEDISFSLKAGRIMGLIGKNGAGKTTILKGILNLIPLNSGSVEMFGMDFHQNEKECKQNIGVVFGEVDYYKQKKISQITEVTKVFYKNWNDSSFNHYLKEFDLDSNKKISELSSGMKVKYSLALALSHNARLLLLDEPTSGLDPVARDDLLNLFQQIVKSSNCSILFSTHIVSDLEKCADDITYIKQGQLVKSTDKATFIQSFQYLNEQENDQISLEDIMIRNERRDYHI